MARYFWIAAACLTVVAAAPTPAKGAEAIKVGIVKVDITPPIGYRMAGYFAERLNDGTIDPLYAKVIVFQQGNEAAAIAICDLVEIPASMTDKIRERTQTATGIPIDAIAVTATHSHTGPLFSGILRDKFHHEAIAKHGSDPAEKVDYPAILVDKVSEAIKVAKEKETVVSLTVGTAKENRLAFNRRFHMKDGPVRFNPGLKNPKIDRVAGPIDPEVEVLFVRSEPGGEPIAALTNFALHLDTVSGTKYSGDYPAILEEVLKTSFGNGFVSLFGTGTCGDINHIDVTKPAVAKTRPIGERLAETVNQAIAKAKPITEPGLRMISEKVEVGVQRINESDLEQAKAMMTNFDPSKIPFLEIVRGVTVLDLAESFTEPKTKLEVQALRLDRQTAIVFLPGEVFVEHGLAIKKGSPFPRTFVIELSNDNPSYIPTRKAFAEGSYEVVNSRVESGGGELMVEGAIRLLNRLAVP